MRRRRSDVHRSGPLAGVHRLPFLLEASVFSQYLGPLCHERADSNGFLFLAGEFPSLRHEVSEAARHRGMLSAASQGHSAGESSGVGGDCVLPAELQRDGSAADSWFVFAPSST